MTVTCPACSWQFNENTKRHRSDPQHRRYFAMIGAAFKNWPESYEYQPLDAEALRVFLQMLAGCVDVVKSAKTGDTYLVPRSIKYSKMSQQTFSELNFRVENIIEKIIGVSGDKLLEMSSEVA